MIKHNHSNSSIKETNSRLPQIRNISPNPKIITPRKNSKRIKIIDSTFLNPGFQQVKKACENRTYIYKKKLMAAIKKALKQSKLNILGNSITQHFVDPISYSKLTKQSPISQELKCKSIRKINLKLMYTNNEHINTKGLNLFNNEHIKNLADSERQKISQGIQTSNVIYQYRNQSRICNMLNTERDLSRKAILSKYSQQC